MSSHFIHTDELCDALARQDPNSSHNATAYERAQEQVQKVSARINTWRFVVDSAFPILWCLVLGAWSDKHGRKPLLISAQLGYICATLSLIVSCSLPSVTVEATIVMFGILSGIGGGSVAVNLAMMAYIADIAPEETRTRRMGVAMFCFLCATPLGSAASGPIFDSIGFKYTFVLSTCCHLAACWYAMFIIKETIDTKQHEATFWRDLLDARQAVHSIRGLFRKRDGWRRVHVVMLCSLVFFTTFSYGEMSFLFFYIRLVFHWTYAQYGFYNTYRFIIMIIGMSFTLGFISHYLKVRDSMVGILGCVSQVLTSIVMSLTFLCPSSWILYVVPVIDFLNGAVIVVNKSMLTKVVQKHELGQLSSVLCAIESVVPIVNNPTYSGVYLATLDTIFPSAAFLVTVAAMLVCITLLTILHYTGVDGDNKTDKIEEVNKYTKFNDP